MIGPEWLGSVGPIVAATGIGLLIRRGLAVHEQRIDERSSATQVTPAAPRPTPRPTVRPAVPAGQGARR